MTARKRLRTYSDGLVAAGRRVAETPASRTANSASQLVANLRAEFGDELAGLFAWGCELVDQPDQPGLAYLIAHAGRELTNCIVRPPERSAGEATTDQHSDEALRANIARAVGLAGDHALVDRWVRAHRELQRSAHARVPGPALAPVRSAFRELQEILDAYFRAFYDAADDLDAIVAAGAGVAPVERVRLLLLQPMQRRRLFARLSSAEWLALFEDAGMFENPPGRIVFNDGAWGGQMWPEGAYLVRMAPTEPVAVSRLLAEVPENNENPLVWVLVAQAIAALPAEHAGPLALKFCRVLQGPLGPHLTRDASLIAESLARRGCVEAVRVVEHLLWWRRTPSDADAIVATVTSGARDASRQLTPVLWHFDSDWWLLDRLDRHEFASVLRTVLPLLEQADARESLQLTATALRVACRRVEDWEQSLAKAVQGKRQDEGDAVDTMILEHKDRRRSSDDWCTDLRHLGHDRGVRAMLAVEVFRQVRALLATGASVADLLTELEGHRHEIFERMQLMLVAETAELDAASRTFLDQFLASSASVEPSYGATEVAALLRAHFTDASTSAQDVFVAALSSSEGAEAFDDAADREAAMARVQNWQRTRLRWFHDRIPEALQPLAVALGVHAAVPSLEQQALDETGRWVGNVRTVAYRSPVGVEALVSQSPLEVARLVAEWRPASEEHDPFETPSLAGLHEELSRLAARQPTFGLKVLRASAAMPFPVRAVSALLHGARTAVSQGRRMSARTVGSWITHGLARTRANGGAVPADYGNVAELVRSVLDLLAVYVERPALHHVDRHADRAHAWNLLASVARDEALLALDNHEDGSSAATGFSAVVQASYARPRARVVEIALRLAWTESLATHARTRWPGPEHTTAGITLLPFLDAGLSGSLDDERAVEAVIGRHLVTLLWMARAWTTAQLPRLLTDGAIRPGEHPAWRSYLERHEYSSPAFSILRPWYAKHAAALTSREYRSRTERDSGWEESLAVHIAWASVHGLCTAGDADTVVERTFAGVPIEARARAYWSLWRGFTNARRVSPAVQSGLLAFWEGRLCDLERQKDGQRAEEVAELARLIATPHLEAVAVIALGVRTMKLLRVPPRPAGEIWNGLRRLSRLDPEGTLMMVSDLTNAIRNSTYPYIGRDEIGPPLRAALRVGGATRDRAVALLHTLGRSGVVDVDDLWKEAKRCKVTEEPASP